MTPGWLLRTRIAPTRDKTTVIVRERLLKTLTSCSEDTVLLVEAPAGFGKTILLAQWAEKLREQGCGVAWFTLDPSDDPPTVLRYLFFVFDQAGLEHDVASAAGAAGMTPPLAVQALLASIERSERRWALVLDDAGGARPDVRDDILAPLVRFAPDRLSIALATDQHLPLPLSEMERRGVLHRIEARDLLFDRADLRTLAGRAATDHQLRMIERKSRGWPMLAQIMIAERFRETGNPKASADAIPIFLRDRLLPLLKESDRHLFERLSLLDRFSPDMVDRLIPDAPNGEALDRLSACGLIHRVPSDEGLDLAVHPAFHDLKRNTVVAADPEGARDFRRLAARVCLSAARYVHATRLAVALGDDELIAEIIDACNPLRFWFEQGLTPLRRIVGLLPDDILRRQPRAGYACIICWSKSGRLKDAGDLFHQLELQMKAQASETLPLALRMERAVCRSILVVYQGVPIDLADVDELDALIPFAAEMTPLVRSAAETLKCYVLQIGSVFDEARAVALEGIDYTKDFHSQYAAFFLHCDLAMIAGVQGRPDEAASIFHDGERTCHAILRNDERLSMIRDAFKLELQHEIDPADTGTALRLRNICRRMPSLENWPDVFAAAFRTYSEKLALSGDDQAALALIDAGLDYARDQDVRSLAYILEHHRILLLVLAGQPLAAESAYRELGQRKLLAPGFMPWRAYEAMIEARAALAFSTRDGEAGVLLDEAVSRVERHGNVRSELRFRCLRAELGAAGEDDDIIARIEAESGFRRPARIAARLRAPPADRDKPILAASPPEARGPAFFTPKEIAVLERVDRGLSDKAIAIELGITPHGVRYHLKRIYALLGVHTRAEASQRARTAAPVEE